MKVFRVFHAFFLAVGLYGQAPTITSIQNPASNILPGLPNFGIAQGQIFMVYGTNFGPATIALAPSLPLGTTLSGTSLKVTQNGVVYNPAIVYVVNNQGAGYSQVAAIMPSGVPLSVNSLLASVQLTYNGVASNSFFTRIVDSNFGISTSDQTGGGPAVVTYPTGPSTYAVVSNSNSAVPGSTYTIWGTGLGPTDSDNNYATKGTFPKIHVIVGGVEASAPYSGLSSGVGLNQINFTIPAGLSGCYVSLIVQSDTTPVRVSNGTTIPISPNGGQCSDSNGFPSSVINSVLTTNGAFSAGVVSMDAEKKQVLGFFLRFNAAQWAAAGNLLGTISPGNCVTHVQVGSGAGAGGVPNSFGLDAGPTLSLTTPAGSIISMPQVQAGVYGGILPGVASGVYNLANGAGGAAVNRFSVNFNGPAAFAWSNANITTVVRSAGQKITWSGGDANSFVDITGSAPGNPIQVNGQQVPSNVNAAFECQVPAQAGSFTIPPSILLAMPSIAGTNPNGTLSVSLQTLPQTLAIPGTDYGFAISNTAPIGANVAYQ